MADGWRRNHGSASPFEPVYGYSRAVRVGNRIDVAGCAPIEPDGYITDAADADRVGQAHGAIFGKIRPAATMLVIPALIRPEWKVEIEAEAILETEI